MLRNLSRCALFGALALAACLALPGESSAQGFYGGDLERGFRPGPNLPRDGMPYSHWYNYEIGPQFYLNLNRWQFAQWEYMDRAYRADTIGLKYAAPWNPCGKQPIFNRVLGQTELEGPAHVPYYPPAPAFPGRFGWGVGVGTFFGR